MESSIILLILLFVCMSISLGVGVWKRNIFFGKGIGASCKPKDFIGCKTGTKCSSAGTCLVPQDKPCKKNTDCMDFLNCTNKMCKPVSSSLNCSGDWISDPTADCKILDSVPPGKCNPDDGLPGKKLKKFDIRVHALNGGELCNMDPDSEINRPVAYEDCRVIKECEANQVPFVIESLCTKTDAVCVKNPTPITCGDVGGTFKTTYNRLTNGQTTNGANTVECPIEMINEKYSEYTSEGGPCTVNLPRCEVNVPRGNYTGQNGLSAFGTTNGFQFVKIDGNGREECLRVVNDDRTVNAGDKVTLGPCDTNDPRDSTWYIHDEKLKSGWNPELCLDYDFDAGNGDNREFKVTRCNGNPAKNRDFRIKWGGDLNINTIVWPSHERLLTNSDVIENYKKNYRPVTIQNTSIGGCIQNPKQINYNNRYIENGRPPRRAVTKQISVCQSNPSLTGCLGGCSTTDSEYYLKNILADNT